MSSIITCPVCGLVPPASAVRCDCGHRFASPPGPKKIEGFGGWLILAAIGVGLLPLRIAAEVVQAQGDWIAVGVNLVLLAASVWLLGAFFSKRRYVPTFVITLQLILFLLVAIVVTVEEKPTRQDVTDVVGATLWTGISMAYFLRSRRVKATFVR